MLQTGCIWEPISSNLGRLLVECDLLCQVADERLLGDKLPGFGVVDRVLTARCIKQVLPFNRERFIDISSRILDVCFDIPQLVYVESLRITRGMEGGEIRLNRADNAHSFVKIAQVCVAVCCLASVDG